MDEAPHERSRMPDPMVVGQRVSHYVVESPLGAGENRPALLDSAAAAFRRAAAADTNDTWAWMGQAQALWCDYQRQPEPSRLQQAAGLCQKALGIDLDCAEA